MLDVHSHSIRKKVATKNKDEKVLTLPSLLNKTTSYEEWIKFKKLLATSSEEEKSEFFKKAKGEYAGRPLIPIYKSGLLLKGVLCVCAREKSELGSLSIEIF